MKHIFGRQYRYWVVTAGILLVAALLRLYQLGSVPHGMTWDEAAIGYNGYAVIYKRRDEWLQRLPVSFKSFGDYKAPLAIYINGVFTYTLGSELWVMRLPFALSGIAAVGVMIWLTTALWSDDSVTADSHADHRARQWGLIAGGLLTFSPWHLHYSRVGFESGMSLFFLLTGVWWLVVLIKNQQPTLRKWRGVTVPWQAILAVGSTVALAASMYTYHSAKLVMPLMVLVVLASYWRQSLQRWRWLVFQGGLGLVLLKPLWDDARSGAGVERFNQATLFNKGLSGSEIMTTIFSHFWSHFTPAYLIFGETPTLRHGDGQWGVLLPTTLVMVMLAVVIAILKLVGLKSLRSAVVKYRVLVIGVAWLVIGTLPAAMGIDVPHSNRALLALPGFILVAIVGLEAVTSWLRGSHYNHQVKGSHGEHDTLLRAVIGCMILAHGAFFLSYQYHYYTGFARAAAEDFKDGYLEAFAYVIPYEKGTQGRKKVEQIVFTTEYGQPYIYALFKRRTNPIAYQGGSLNTYLFVDKVSAGDLSRPNTVIVASAQDDLPLDKAEKIIYGSDGQVRFKIYVTQ